MRQFLFLLTLLASTAHAGWISGGGELLRDSKNPWFLKNVKTVWYCVEMDELNFGQTRARAEQLIERAFEKWKLEFKNQVPMTGHYDWQIATQDFKLAPNCAGKPDIRFQFGKLTGEQFQKLEDPTRFIGITVRTDYNKRTMHGQGFVYISPSYGPLKIHREGLLEGAWSYSNGGLLYLVLLHEIGHIFGVPHHQTPYSLMGERYVEYIMNKKNAIQHAAHGALYPQPSIFRYHGTLAQLLMCGDGAPSGIRNQFFGLKPDHNCFSAGVENNKLIIKSGKIDQPTEIAGEAILQRHDGLKDIDPLMHIWLPREQVVYRPMPGISSQLLPGPFVQSRSRFKGTYKSADGKVSREVFVIAEPAKGFDVGGVLDGKVYTDLAQEF